VSSVLSRRLLLRRCAYLPLASVTLLPLLVGCDKASITACADPQLLSRGEEQMRKTLDYIDASEDPLQLCSGCQFFSAADAHGCGHCEILDGSVSGQGFCTSWAGRS
jgi:hypothetical protein